MRASAAQLAREQPVLVAAAGLLRVNIGCGTTAAPGWYNIDNSPTIWLSRLPWARLWLQTPAWPHNVCRHNVLKGLPFGEEVWTASTPRIPSSISPTRNRWL